MRKKRLQREVAKITFHIYKNTTEMKDPIIL